MKKIGVFVASEQKGFLIALSYQLEKIYGFSVIIFARDSYVVDLSKKILPYDSRVKTIDVSDLSTTVDRNLILKEAERIEKEYGIKLSMLISEDRALGQGYLSNVQKIPDIKRASWSYERKIGKIVTDIISKEKILDGLDAVFQVWPNKTITTICKKQNIYSFSFTQIKFGDRIFWSDNDYITSSLYIGRLKEYIDNYKNRPIIQYNIDKASDNFNKSMKYSYKLAFNKSIRIVINDAKKLIRRNNKKHSYHYFGWVPSVFRKVYNYNYVKKRSKTPNDLSSYNIVFFTLHLEPEVALQYFSPEFSNSMEAITWISKSLPTNYILVVKEQASSYGVRSKWYYEQLIKMPNVVISHPSIHSWSWIESSSMVATITGTSGQEAVHFERPVISFGMHQIINYLPTVYYVSNFMETNLAIDEIIHKPPTKEEYRRSRVAFSNAQVDSSINMPKYKDTYYSTELELDMALESLNHLADEYPQISIFKK